VERNKLLPPTARAMGVNGFPAALAGCGLQSQGSFKRLRPITGQLCAHRHTNGPHAIVVMHAKHICCAGKGLDAGWRTHNNPSPVTLATLVTLSSGGGPRYLIHAHKQTFSLGRFRTRLALFQFRRVTGLSNY